MVTLNPDIAYNNLVSWIAKDVASKHKSIRYGQYYFNKLHEAYPELADKIRGTDADPFHNDNKLPKFWKAIHDHFKTI